MLILIYGKNWYVKFNLVHQTVSPCERLWSETKLPVTLQKYTELTPHAEHLVTLLISFYLVMTAAPHQPRLDWQMWFAALGSYEHNPWLVHLVYRLLIGQKEGTHLRP